MVSGSVIGGIVLSEGLTDSGTPAPVVAQTVPAPAVVSDRLMAAAQNPTLSAATPASLNAVNSLSGSQTGPQSRSLFDQIPQTQSQLIAFPAGGN
jgi:hypothetical protein